MQYSGPVADDRAFLRVCFWYRMPTTLDAVLADFSPGSGPTLRPEIAAKREYRFVRSHDSLVPFKAGGGWQMRFSLRSNTGRLLHENWLPPKQESAHMKAENRHQTGFHGFAAFLDLGKKHRRGDGPCQKLRKFVEVVRLLQKAET